MVALFAVAISFGEHGPRLIDARPVSCSHITIIDPLEFIAQSVLGGDRPSEQREGHGHVVKAHGLGTALAKRKNPKVA